MSFTVEQHVGIDIFCRQVEGDAIVGDLVVEPPAVDIFQLFYQRLERGDEYIQAGFLFWMQLAEVCTNLVGEYFIVQYRIKPGADERRFFHQEVQPATVPAVSSLGEIDLHFWFQAPLAFQFTKCLAAPAD